MASPAKIRTPRFALTIARFTLPTLFACLLMGAERPTEAPPVIEKYSWRNVVIGAGGFVTGLAYHPSARGLFYARTDVGEAYRFDAERLFVPLQPDDFGSHHAILSHYRCIVAG